MNSAAETDELAARQVAGRELLWRFFAGRRLDTAAALHDAWVAFRDGLSETERAAVDAWLAGVLRPVAVEIEAVTEREALAAELARVLREVVWRELA